MSHRIEGTYLVSTVDHCTCDPHYGAHQPSCGLEPEVDLSTLPGYAELFQVAAPPAPVLVMTSPAPPNNELRSEIKTALNRASAENASGTPDHVLADFLLGCLSAYDAAVTARASWRGEDTELPRLSRVSAVRDDVLACNVCGSTGDISLRNLTHYRGETRCGQFVLPVVKAVEL